MPHVFVSHISFWRSRPSCHTTTLQTKHTQIQDTWVANSHACFKETALKTLKPILRQHLQEYKIYKASKALFFKPLKLCLLKRGDYALPHAFVAHISFWRSRPSCHTTTLQTKHTQIQDTWVANSHACFKETALKTLKPILRQHPQEYKIYRAPSLHFIKMQAGTIHHILYLQ